MPDMIFNGVDFTPYLKVEQIRRHMLAPRSVVSTKMPGVIGERFVKLEQGPRPIEVDIRINQPTRELTLDKAKIVAGLLHAEEPRQLILRDDPTRYSVAILSERTLIENLMHTGFTTLVFSCLNPLSYNIDTTTKTLGLSTSINNFGTAEVGGVITVTMANTQSYLEVSQLETGKRIHIEHNFIAGDKVIIDLDDESVKKNGSLIMKDVYLTSDFFKLPVGLSTIKLSSGSGSLVYRLGWL